MALSVGVPADQAPPPQIQAQTQSATQELPAFRSRITLVPLDVRVLDRDGKPITDLSRDDFTILENDKPQVIAHFSASGLVAGPPPPRTQNRPALRQAPGAQFPAARSRTFLLVIGRGRIQEPFDGIGALIAFVRDRLLPQDRVAVMAYHRVTDFTADHEKVVTLLQRIRERHERIDALLEHYSFGMQAQLARCKACLPDSILPMINELFLFPGALVSREMPQSLGQDEDLFGGLDRRFYDAVLEAELAGGRAWRTIGDDRIARRAELAGGNSTASFVNESYKTWQDRDKLLNGIAEMRYFEGEKHIVFVSDQGLFLRSRDQDAAIAKAASDARIALHTIVTGGIADEIFRGQVMKNLAAETGGTASITRYPREALAAVDEITRFEYLLGYYPDSTAHDGKFREVKVKVNRPGATVLVRNGYYDEDVIIPADRAAFVAHQRLASVGNNRDLIRDVTVSLKASQARSANKTVQGDVMVEMKVGTTRLAFDLVDGRHVGQVEFRIYCGDSKEQIVGQTQGVMRLSLTEATYAKYSRDGIPYVARVPVTAKPKTVKVIVYDPTADLAGSMVAPVR